METLVVLLTKEEIHAQQMNENFTLLIPGFSGPGNDLRIVLSPAAQEEVAKDLALVARARAIETASQSQSN